MKDKKIEEFFEEYNMQLVDLRCKYMQVEAKIAELMQRNFRNPIANYQEKLDDLITCRDEIGKQIELVIHMQKEYRKAVHLNIKQEHKAILDQVEKMLWIRVPEIKNFFISYRKFNDISQVVSKDSFTLMEERGIINLQLDDLYYDNQLDHDTWQKMKRAVRLEYDRIVDISQTSTITYNNGGFTDFFDKRDNCSFEFQKVEDNNELIEEKIKMQIKDCGEMLEENYDIEDPNFILHKTSRQHIKRIEEINKRP